MQHGCQAKNFLLPHDPFLLPTREPACRRSWPPRPNSQIALSFKTYFGIVLRSGSMHGDGQDGPAPTSPAANSTLYGML